MIERPPHASPCCPVAGTLERTPDTAAVYSCFTGLLEGLNGHAAVVVTDAPSTSAAGFLADAAANHACGRLGVDGRRVALAAYALQKMESHPALLPFTSVLEHAMDQAGSSVSGEPIISWAPGGSRYGAGYIGAASQDGSSQGGSSQAHHVHGASGPHRVPAGSSTAQRATCGIHTLHVGFRIGDGPFSFRRGGAGGPEATIWLPHGSFWIMNDIAAGETVYRPAASPAEAVTDRSWHHGVPLTLLTFATIMRKVRLPLKVLVVLSGWDSGCNKCELASCGACHLLASTSHFLLIHFKCRHPCCSTQVVVLAPSRAEAVRHLACLLAAAAEEMYGHPRCAPMDLSPPPGVCVGACTNASEPARQLQGRLGAWAGQRTHQLEQQVEPPQQQQAGLPMQQQQQRQQLEVQPQAAPQVQPAQSEQEQQQAAHAASLVGPHFAEISYFRSMGRSYARSVLAHLGAYPFMLLCPALHDVVLAHSISYAEEPWAQELRRQMSEQQTAAVRAMCTPAAAQAAGEAAATELQSMHLTPVQRARVREHFSDGEHVFVGGWFVVVRVGGYSHSDI